MTELEKAASGLLYDANSDPALLEARCQIPDKILLCQSRCSVPGFYEDRNAGCDQ